MTTDGKIKRATDDGKENESRIMEKKISHRWTRMNTDKKKKDGID
jgi:hypothetical protein